MFSIREKKMVAERIQNIIRATQHPELPDGEINFDIHIEGKESWSWADIKNNGRCSNLTTNQWNEDQDRGVVI